MSEEADLLVVLCTASQREADPLAGHLVEERLAACVNIAPVRSCYIWEGKPCRDEEVLLIIKTRKSFFEPLRKRIVELHSYAVPEIIALPISEGHGPYIEWALARVG